MKIKKISGKFGRDLGVNRNIDSLHDTQEFSCWTADRGDHFIVLSACALCQVEIILTLMAEKLKTSIDKSAVQRSLKGYKMYLTSDYSTIDCIPFNSTREWIEQLNRETGFKNRQRMGRTERMDCPRVHSARITRKLHMTFCLRNDLHSKNVW
jgi:hypothetical protein